MSCLGRLYSGSALPSSPSFPLSLVYSTASSIERKTKKNKRRRYAAKAGNISGLSPLSVFFSNDQVSPIFSKVFFFCQIIIIIINHGADFTKKKKKEPWCPSDFASILANHQTLKLIT